MIFPQNKQTNKKTPNNNDKKTNNKKKQQMHLQKVRKVALIFKALSL